MATKTEGCKCIPAVNKTLAKSNARLKTSFRINFSTGKSSEILVLPLEKIEKSRKPLPSLVCTFCPFCGKKLYKVKRP